jgi:putative component of toxin-antitoxin plasmid stabilization module
MLPPNLVEVLEYLEPDGYSPYAEWFNSLNPPAAAKVAVALTPLARGNFSNVKSVGGGVHEYRIDSVRAAGFISGRKASLWSCCSAAEPRSDSS